MILKHFNIIFCFKTYIKTYLGTTCNMTLLTAQDTSKHVLDVRKWIHARGLYMSAFFSKHYQSMTVLSIYITIFQNSWMIIYFTLLDFIISAKMSTMFLSDNVKFKDKVVHNYQCMQIIYFQCPLQLTHKSRVL